MITQDPSYHTNKFFVSLEESKDFKLKDTKNFQYKDVIQRGIKNLSKEKIAYAYQFEMQHFQT